MDNIELVLVGDGCRINEDLVPKCLKTRIHNFDKHQGVVIARSKGIDFSAADLLAFIDADCVADSNWLRRLISGFLEEDIGGCGGSIIGSEDSSLYEDRIYGTGYILPCTGLGNAIFRKDVLKKIGGFDGNLDYGAEEVDICWRLYLKGYRIEYIPEAIVEHKTKREVKDFLLYGAAIPSLVNKYSAIFHISSLTELKALISQANLSYSPAGGSNIYNIAKTLALFYGYVYGLLKEKISFRCRLDKAGFAEAYLADPSSIRPLQVMRNAKPVIKPNYIIWWKRKDGCAILNLLSRERYLLGNVSADMWRHLMSGKNKKFIIQQIADGYRAETQGIELDFEDFIENLHERGVLITANC